MFFFVICFDLIQVKMQFTESLTGGFEVSKSDRGQNEHLAFGLHWVNVSS